MEMWCPCSYSNIYHISDSSTWNIIGRWLTFLSQYGLFWMCYYGDYTIKSMQYCNVRHGTYSWHKRLMLVGIRAYGYNRSLVLLLLNMEERSKITYVMCAIFLLEYPVTKNSQIPQCVLYTRIIFKLLQNCNIYFGPCGWYEGFDRV